MITWHVVQAQLPPQACSSGTPRFLATSRNDSGLPWCEYGSLPCSNSTTVGSPSMMNVTLGIDVFHVFSGQGGLDGPVHDHLGQMLRRVVERLRPLLYRFAVLRIEHHLEAREDRFDLLALAGRELALLDLGEVGVAQRFFGRLHHVLGIVARLDQQPRGE